MRRARHLFRRRHPREDPHRRAGGRRRPRGACLADTVRADLDALAKLARAHRGAASACCSFCPSSTDAPWWRAQHRGRRHHPPGRRRQRDHRVRRLQADQRRGRRRRQARRRAGDGARRRSQPRRQTRCSRIRRFAATPAAARKSFVSMEGLYLLGFGPRTARAARDLAAASIPRSRRSAAFRARGRVARPMPANDADGGARDAGRRMVAIGGGRRGRDARALGGDACDGASWQRRLAPPVFRCRGCRQRSGSPVATAIRRCIARDQLVLWSVRLPRIAHRADHRRIARGERHDHAGPVSQSAGRPGAGRRVERRRACGGDHHRGRRPHARGRPDRSLPFEILPIAAFFGSLAATIGPLSHRDARRAAPRSRSFCSAGSRSRRSPTPGIGLLVFLADDRQLRDITFWLLGSLGGATWAKVATVAAVPARDAARDPVHRPRARPAGAGRGRGVPHGRRGRAA